MIIPYRDERGRRNGFLAGDVVYNLSGRRLGKLIGDQVIDAKLETVAEVRGDQLTMVRRLPWPARTIDAIRSALRHVGLMPLHEAPD